jgi:hypothetical protein
VIAPYFFFMLGCVAVGFCWGYMFSKWRTEKQMQKAPEYIPLEWCDQEEQTNQGG